MSVGSFTAANTAYQYRAGVNDSIDLFVEDMKVANGEFEERENKELRRILAENAGATVEWLSSIGVQFLGPTPEPPYEKPRMHNVLPNSSAYAEALLRECRKRGVQVRTSMRVEKLLRNAAGEIIGASANGTEYFGRRGVILATGDYSASTEMKAESSGRTPPRSRRSTPTTPATASSWAPTSAGSCCRWTACMRDCASPPPPGRTRSRCCPRTPCSPRPCASSSSGCQRTCSPT